MALNRGCPFPFFANMGANILNLFRRTKHYTQDSAGNHWYLHTILSGSGSLLDRIGGKVDYDMTKDIDKSIALNICTPLSTVIDKSGTLLSNGKFYVMDKDGNESTSNEDIRALLKNPNALQTGKQFLKQVEMSLKLFGYCPIYTLRALKSSLPKAMWIIPPELFHLKSTGKLFAQTDLKDIISSAYIEWGDGKTMLKPEDYFFIYDSEAQITGHNDDEITFKSPTDSLSLPVSNWVAQMAASSTLLVNGGPKGIIHNEDTSEFANAALTSKERDELNEKFKSKYGLVNKAFSILVTKAKIGWIPLNYDSAQLKLHEEDKRCTDKIANAIGLNPNIFSSESKYENQESAERKAYQGLIVPDSELICEALTAALCPEGVYITLDFSHIDCLQTNKKDAASALVSVNNAISGMFKAGIITKDEARIEIAKYIDINPDKPLGDYGNNEEK